LIKKNIFKFINHIKKTDSTIPITLFTNGTIMNEKIAEFIKNGKVKAVLSIDGDKKTNDKSRVFKNKKISVHDTAINNFKKYDLISYTIANMVVTRKNIAFLSSNVSYLYELGFRKIGWNIDYSDDWEIKDIKKIKRELNEMFKRYLNLIKEKKELYEISNRYEIIDDIFKNKIKECSNITLLPDGKFYLCDKLIGADEQTLKGFDISDKTIEKRKLLFKKFKSLGFKSTHLFCQIGAYFFYNYVKKSDIDKKMKIILEIQKTISQTLKKQFKILIKYNSFRRMHGIKNGK
ncbi:MAG: hypothetical protein AB1602_08615, partial [Elusimicrobiota bacterium]